MQKDVIQKIKTAPKEPGIYIFYRGQTPLYVGKASNLKNRLKSYLQISDIKTETLHREADKLKLLELRSNIEALIVESQLIKSLKPKLNILWRDDKNYFYVAVTREKFPKVFITHQPEKVDKSKSCKFISPGEKLANFKTYKLETNFIGPFTDGQSLKAVLRLLRRHFPYCSCQPHLRLCLNAQIGNCPGFCCQLNDKKQTTDDKRLIKKYGEGIQLNDQRQTTNDKRLIKNYNNNIRKIKNVLAGKDKNFLRRLKDPYELLILEKIWAHKPYLEQSDMEHGTWKNNALSHFPLNISLIECYDNSHLSGKEAVGAMTAWKRVSSNIPHLTSNWISEKSLWRKFKIRGRYTEDDPRMMEEIVRRRLNHPEWPYPDLIIIDGGITQLNAARRALQKSLRATPYDLRPKIISFAKPHQLVFGLKSKPIPINQLPEELKKLILLAIDRTHNFAQSYHRQVRRKALLSYT